MSKPVEVNENDFDQVVLQSEIPVLVDFWAPWCRPCLMASPILEELANEYTGKIAIAKLNVDQSAKIALQYGVMSIPNLIIFKDGKRVNQVVGYKPKDELKQFVDSVLF